MPATPRTAPPRTAQPRTPPPAAPPPATNLLLLGLVAGSLASFVKWGAEVPLPPRRPGQPSPPDEMLRDIGMPVDAMTYRYSGRTLNYAGAAVHHLFSLAFGTLYLLLVERRPRLGRRFGTGYGLGITVLFHGIVLPLGGWAPPPWKLPPEEIASETLGHLLWIWTIDLVRRGLCA